MALQDIIGGLYYPEMDMGDRYADRDATTLVVDASGEKAAFILQIPKTGTLGKVGFRTGTCVQTQTIKVSFQDVDATTGHPDGNIDQYREISVADTDDNVYKETGLVTSNGTDGGTKRSVTKGDYLAIVFEHSSFNAGDILRLTSLSVLAGSSYVDLYTSAAWAKKAFVPTVCLFYDDDSLAWSPQFRPIATFGDVAYTINTGSSPDEVALRLVPPFACQVGGWHAYMSIIANATFEVILYDSGGTALATWAGDPDITQANGTYLHFRGLFPTPVTLTAGSTYYLAIKPTSANNVNVLYGDVAAAAHWDGFQGGQAIYAVTRADGGAWSAVTTRRLFANVFITALDDGAGTGGGGGPLVGLGGLVG